MSRESKCVFDELKQKKKNIEMICQKYGVADIRVFGSAIRNDLKQTSDVDLLIHVEQESGMSLFDLAKLQEELEQIIKRPVDLVLEDTLPPAIMNRVLEEAQPL